MPRKNVFVLGLDPFNRRVLEQLPAADSCEFHELLSFDDAKGRSTYRFDQVLAQAERRLAGFEAPIGAIMGFWDFPVSSTVPILCERFGVPGPRLGSVLKCEHKFWSRLEQRVAVPEACPRFQAVDPFADDVSSRIEIPYPYWIKPVKGTSSALAYRVTDEQDLATALEAIRGGIGDIADAFDELVDHAHLLPDKVREVSGDHCIVESALPGSQCTTCGFAHAHDVQIYAVVDSLTYPGGSVFQRLQYPSRLPRSVQQRLTDLSRRVIEHIGLDDCAFNIEFIVDEESDSIGLLEINPRISQSHGEIFAYVDGVADHQVMLDLALGRKPDLPHREGPYRVAAKWYYRRFENGFVERAPTDEELLRIESEIPGVMLKTVAKAGIELADMREQDPSAYDLAYVWMGADDEDRLEEKYEQVVDRLDFRISEPRAGRDGPGGHGP